jgi:hypothetical protein
MDKRGKKAPQKSFVRCIEYKAATSEHNTTPRNSTEYKLGTSRRCDDRLTVFWHKLWIGCQSKRRRGPNESEVAGSQEDRIGMGACQNAFPSFDPAEQKVIALVK